MSLTDERGVEPGVDLHEVLDCTAHRIADHGTRSESGILEALAALAGTLCPSAAEALVDWEGPEIVRLRAFGVVHRALVRELDSMTSAAQAATNRVPALTAELDCRDQPVTAGHDVRSRTRWMRRRIAATT
jgi:hypothetical protein